VRSFISLALLALVATPAEARHHHRYHWRYYDEPRVVVRQVVRQVVREAPAKACVPSSRRPEDALEPIGWPDPWIDAAGLQRATRWRL
jgi:hypothetical protein